MTNYLLISITCLSLVLTVFFLSKYLKYLNLYRNLRSNFNSFLDFVDKKYIRKNDVYLRNATIEALKIAKERKRKFEIKAYTKLLKRLKEEG